MVHVNQVLLIFHFIGLTMGVAVPFANIAMAIVMSKATPAENQILIRFPLVMSKVGKTGLSLLWVTGLAMVFTKWKGFSNLPWAFHAKLTVVVLLTIAVGYISILERRFKKGDQSAIETVKKVGGVAFALALVAIVFAVLTFN